MLKGIEKKPGIGLIDRFVGQSTSHADRVAIVSGGQVTTYGDLYSRMLAYAKVFIAGETISGAIVICLPRGVELIAAMLACQYCRIPYIPVDLCAGGERLPKIMENTGYTLLFDSRQDCANITEIDKSRKFDISLFTCAAEPADRSSCSPSRQADEDVESYRIYTSGSTGAPKAVMVLERGCRNVLDFFCGLLESGDDISWLSSTSVSFDIFFIEYAVPLAVGGRLILLTDEEARSSQEIARLLAVHKPVVYQATPSVLKCVLPYLDSGYRFRKLLVGGEDLSSRLSGELVRRSNWLCNVYGPTETTVWSTFNIINSPGDRRIGKPIQNTQIYILNENFQCVQPGQSGKIFIGGAGVAAGYCGNEPLTSEKFRGIAFDGSPTPVYDTGDIGFIDDQGILNYERREGDFYKINGNRVDLSEIVDALEALEWVGEAAVSVVGTDEGGGDVLVGFVRKRTATDVFDEQESRKHLRRKLPRYMVPHYIVEAETFKYTTSGKLDRNDLDSVATRIVGMAASRNGFHLDVLLSALAKYVSVDGLGENDNIFDRGLTSMQAVSLHLELTKYCPDMELYHIFDEPTLRGFRAHLSTTI